MYTARATRCRRVLLPLAAAALITASLPGLAQAAAPASCLDALPVADVQGGMTGHGLTVSKGTKPQPFTATVRGRLTDGIAPGVDMIIAELDSPALDAAGGVWAGMSGSPVYDDDADKLIGAVAYGLSFGPSKIAGITPAETMGQDLLAASPAAVGGGTKTVALSRTLRQRLVRSGAATAAEADSGLTPLPTPLGVVGGLSGKRLQEFAKRLDINNVRVYSAGAVGAGAGDPAEIVPGGNYAAALSYGDITAGGVGTTTAVCGDDALAFGHPFGFFGPTTLSVHTADALTVQDDPTLTPFKLANIGGPVGTVDQDRLVGLHSLLGAVPITVPVTSHVTAESRSRDGRTDINVAAAVPDLAPFHQVVNIDRVFDHIGEGTSTLRWVVRGKRADGSDWAMTRDNRFASPFDVSFESVFEMFEALAQINGNQFEDAKITSLHAEQNVEGLFRSYRIEKLLARRPDGRWVTVTGETPIPAVAGSRLNLRAVLAPYKKRGTTRTLTLRVVVPPAASGGFAMLTVAGGAGFGDGEFGGGFFEDGQVAAPKSFDALLKSLASAPRNDDVTATLRVESDGPAGPGGGIVRTARARADQVVTGFVEVPVEIRSPARARPGHVDGGRWSLRHDLSTGRPGRLFSMGSATHFVRMGDWNGNGTVTPGVFRDGRWTLRRYWTDGSTNTFTFGQAGDVPVVGDWNGDGNDDIGVYRKGRWLLRTSRSAGPATLDFTFGPTPGRPVSGDWNGDGIDTVGVVRDGRWTLAIRNATGSAAPAFRFGRAGDRPVVGDWDADGYSEPGVFRSGIWLLSHHVHSGPVARAFQFGGRGSRPVVWR